MALMAAGDRDSGRGLGVSVLCAAQCGPFGAREGRTVGGSLAVTNAARVTIVVVVVASRVERGDTASAAEYRCRGGGRFIEHGR